MGSERRPADMVDFAGLDKSYADGADVVNLCAGLVRSWLIRL